MRRPGDTEEARYSDEVEMWANAASDHFYDLDGRAPQPLKQLADLTLTMGHGFTGRVWNPEDMRTVRQLWQDSCLALDKQLGVEDGDWGQW